VQPKVPPSPALPIAGYVLAGGRSSRMGADKSLLQLAGKPLIAHAVAKLGRLCAAVHILGGNPALAAYAPLVEDLHPGIGPLGGIEAALAHTAHDWNLILPVDLPFFPAALLYATAISVLRSQPRGVRIAMFTLLGVPQPALLLIHREVAPYLARAVAKEQYKLFSVLEAAARQIEAGIAPAARDSAIRQIETQAMLLEDIHWEDLGEGAGDESWQTTADAQRRNQHLWFANLNTPADVAEAESHLDALDP